MTLTKAQRFWRGVRKFFRGLRILVLLGLFTVVAAFVYFHLVGLPDFLKHPLLARLEAQGWKVAFGNMRWHFQRGVVIEDAAFARTGTNGTGPSFSAHETDLDVDLVALRHSHLQLDSLTVRGGTILYPPGSNQPPMTVSNVQTTVRFGEDDRIEISPFTASFHGANIEINGSLTNVSALREFRAEAVFPSAGQGTGPETHFGPQELARILDQIHFTAPPELKITLHGDARDWQHFAGELKLTADGAETPWGNLNGVKVFARTGDKEATGEEPRYRLEISAVDVRTPWAAGQDLSCRALVYTPSNRTEVRTELQAALNRFETRWMNGAATNLVQALTTQLTLQLTNVWGNPQPLGAGGQWRLRQAKVDVAPGGPEQAIRSTLEEGDFLFTYEAARTNRWQAEKRLGFWLEAAPWTLAWNLNFGAVETPQLKLQTLALAGEWAMPELKIRRLGLQLDGGKLELQGGVEVLARRIFAEVTSSVDAQKVKHLTGRNVSRFLGKFSWAQPPQAEGKLEFRWPDWTNLKPDWEAEIIPTLLLDGHATVGKGAYRTVPALAAEAWFQYTNEVWILPEIRVKRPEGEIRLQHRADEKTRDFHWKVDGLAYLPDFRGEFPPEAQPALDLFHFDSPAEVHAEIDGNWRHLETFWAQADLSVTNFSFRDIPVAAFHSEVTFTNRQLALTNTQLTAGGGHLEAPVARLDLNEARLYVTNVLSTADPLVLTEMIGPKTREAIEPYAFAEPPTVRVHGSVPVTGDINADLHFEVAGKKFQWGYFQADRINSRVDWVGDDLVITNAVASAYDGGQLGGWGHVNFGEKDRSTYELACHYTNVNVNVLSRHFGKTNGIEGRLDGWLAVTAADTRGLETWFGHGRANLSDGLLWEIPMFGMFSPMLEAISPGLGKSRAREAAATFTITNGVAVTEDLQIFASVVRLKYRGTIDYQMQVDAKVEAEILRDAWVVGRIVSAALLPLSKLFECKVTGPADNPVMKPIYIPKFLLMTLRPFHTIKTLMQDKPDKEESPPAKKP